MDEMHLWGYVAHPSQSRSTAKGQFLFLGRPIRPRPVAEPRAERGVSRPADGRADARGVPPPGHPARGGRRQRPPDQGRGPVPRLEPDLQPPAGDAPPDVPEERPALAAPGGAGAGPPADGRAPRGRRRRSDARGSTGEAGESAPTAWADSTWPAGRPTGRRWPRGSSRAGPARMARIGPEPPAPAWAQSLAHGVRGGTGRGVRRILRALRGPSTAGSTPASPPAAAGRPAEAPIVHGDARCRRPDGRGIPRTAGRWGIAARDPPPARTRGRGSRRSRSTTAT